MHVIIYLLICVIGQFSCIFTQFSFFFYFQDSFCRLQMHKSSHFSGHSGATVCVRALALPLPLSDGTAALTMVSPLPWGGDTSEWFVVGEDWWTAIATPFLCEINSTCRSVLYEWWRPPQVIHTAAQRHSSGPHRTYKAGIKQSLFPTGPCITDPRPHTNTPTWIPRWRGTHAGNPGNSARYQPRPFKFISKGFSAVSSKSLPQHNCQSLHSDTALPFWTGPELGVCQKERWDGIEGWLVVHIWGLNSIVHMSSIHRCHDSCLLQRAWKWKVERNEYLSALEAIKLKGLSLFFLFFFSPEDFNGK